MADATQRGREQRRAALHKGMLACYEVIDKARKELAELDETGRITQTAECPGPRWVEVPPSVNVPQGQEKDRGDDDEAFRQFQRDRIAEAQRHDAEQAKTKLTDGVQEVPRG